MRKSRENNSRSRKRRHDRLLAAEQRAAIAKSNNTKFKESWSNQKSALVGYLTGQGYTSVSISEALDDGTSPDTIRRMWSLWKLSGDQGEGRYNESVPIPLSSGQRMRLNEMAAGEEMEAIEFIRKIVVIVIQDKHDLYKAIIDE